MRSLFLLTLLGCADPSPPLQLVGMDARIDAACTPVDASPDDCCRFAPDRDRVAACEQPLWPHDSCGVAVCQLADCSLMTLNVCGAMTDAGVDAR